MIVRESISFTRGNDPKNVLGIGQRYLIEKWLDEMDIEKYIINDDMTINIKRSGGYININNKNLVYFPDYIQFNKIIGSFNCNDNKLISLRGCPRYVSESFFCSRNYLTSLEYAPIEVGSEFFLYR